MGTTPTYALRYPEATDPADVPTDIHELATDVEAALSGLTVALPIGAIIDYAPGAVPPANFLSCDGQAVSRTTYATLFGLLGTTYGAGNGTSTFNLPDLRGRAVVGKGTHADVAAVGASEGLAVGSRSPKHRHTVGDTGHAHPGTFTDAVSGSAAYDAGRCNVPQAGYTGQSALTGITVGVAGASLDAPPYLVLQKIIRAL